MVRYENKNMHGLAYTNNYKSARSHKKTEKRLLSEQTITHNFKLVTHKTTAQHLCVYQSINKTHFLNALLPFNPFKTSPPLVNTQRNPATAPQLVACYKKEKVDTSKVSTLRRIESVAEEKARSEFEEKSLRLHMEIFGGLYMRSR